MTDQKIKTLAQLKEEIDPQGEKAEKEDLLGVTLQVIKIKPYLYQGHQAVRIVAYRSDTAELVHFSGGQPMLNSIEGMADHVPFECELVKYTPEGKNEFWLLE